MEDFSLPGLLVDRYEEACALLRADGVTLVEGDGVGVELELAAYHQLPAVLDRLAQGRISCQLADIADTIYQA